MTLAWHFTSAISGLTLAPVGLQGDPPDWSWGKSASSGSFSARLPTPLTVCRLDWLWSIAMSRTTLLFESELLKVYNTLISEIDIIRSSRYALYGKASLGMSFLENAFSVAWKTLVLEAKQSTSKQAACFCNFHIFDKVCPICTVEK